MFVSSSQRMGTFNETATQWWYNSSSYFPPNNQELQLHQELISRWASFARTGSPNNNNYLGWSPVPSLGPNSDGSATLIDQLFFSLEYGGFMSGSNAASAIDRCSAFPNWEPFSVITQSPTFSPTTYFPSRSPTRRPTRRPVSRSKSLCQLMKSRYRTDKLILLADSPSNARTDSAPNSFTYTEADGKFSRSDSNLQSNFCVLRRFDSANRQSTRPRNLQLRPQLPSSLAQ